MTKVSLLLYSQRLTTNPQYPNQKKLVLKTLVRRRFWLGWSSKTKNVMRHFTMLSAILFIVITSTAYASPVHIEFRNVESPDAPAVTVHCYHYCRILHRITVSVIFRSDSCGVSGRSHNRKAHPVAHHTSYPRVYQIKEISRSWTRAGPTIRWQHWLRIL